MHQSRDQLRLDSLMGTAAAVSTDGTGGGYLLIGPVVTGSILIGPVVAGSTSGTSTARSTKGSALA